MKDNYFDKLHFNLFNVSAKFDTDGDFFVYTDE